MNLAYSLGSALLHVRPAPLAAALKSLLRLRRREFTTSDGVFWIDPASDAGQRIWRHGSYDSESIALLQRVLKPGNTFVDVGANEGFFCVPAARLVGETGRVIALEPQSRLREVLERNFSLNGSRVEVHSVAVSDHAGTANLFLTPNVNNSASSLHAHTRYRLPSQPVRIVTLAGLFDELGLSKPVVVKMDIEGFEQEAILGSPELFRTGRISALMLELHSAYIAARGLDPEAVPRFLESCGYTHLAGAHGMVWIKP